MDFRSSLLKSGRKKKKSVNALGQRHKRMFRLKIALAVFIFISILALFAWLLRLPEVTISNVDVSGNNITSTEEIDSIVYENLNGTYFYLVPKNSTFFYSKNRIERVLDFAFPRIKEVEVEKTNANTISVTVAERVPFAIWCGDAHSLDGENLGNCYFMDEHSYLYAKAPDFTGSVFFKYFGNIDVKSFQEEKAPLGASYMNTESFFDIRPFIETFEDLGYNPVSLTRVDAKDFELRMDDGAVIIFGVDTKLSVLLDNMESILDSDAFAEAGGTSIEYIDLRFGNKVYYKFVDEEENLELDNNVE